MSAAAPWPPRVGALLPRAREAYAEPRKLRWLLSDAGHGTEWSRVLHIGPQDSRVFWEAIAEAVLQAPISGVRDLRPYGVNCEVRIAIGVGDRTAGTLTAWHYASASDAPRLVTAHPKL